MFLTVFTLILTIIYLALTMYQYTKGDNDWQYSAFWATFMLIITTMNIQMM